MKKITYEEVERVRARFAEALGEAAERFRESFAQASAAIPPNERWRSHLEIQAASMLARMSGVRLREGYRVAYFIDESTRTIAPVAHAVGEEIPRATRIEDLPPDHVLFPFMSVERSGEAILEYWMLTSELLSSSEWKMTRLIANGEEYDALLASMDQPQIVNALYASYLPEFEFQEDGSAFLDVTVFSRAAEERIERRRLFLDVKGEFQFHSRQLIAEGRGGVGR